MSPELERDVLKCALVAAGVQKQAYVEYGLAHASSPAHQAALAEWKARVERLRAAIDALDTEMCRRTLGETQPARTSQPGGIKRCERCGVLYIGSSCRQCADLAPRCACGAQRIEPGDCRYCGSPGEG
jgi:hypothetical protein